jgi:hypothetical protein
LREFFNGIYAFLEHSSNPVDSQLRKDALWTPAVLTGLIDAQRAGVLRQDLERL